MKNKSIIVLVFFISAWIPSAYSQEKAAVNHLLDQWHKAAAEANFNAYFNAFTDQAVFIGTDAGEIWTKKQFQDFAQPYFESKKTWNFKALQRNIYFSDDQKTAWFDELLDTWMGISRGSGVLIKDPEGKWKIAHYVLSATIPNEKMNEVVKIKKEADALILEHYKK